MNSRLTLVALIAVLSVWGCKKETVSDPSAGNDAPSSPRMGRSQKWLARYSGSDYSQAIKIDSANQMIASYLASINYPGNDTALRSLTFDADTLRSYLADNRIVTLKFMLAHRPEYINAGKYGMYAGMKSSALTVVIVGLDENDHYIYNDRNMVYEHAFPCPANCPGSSSALLLK